MVHLIQMHWTALLLDLLDELSIVVLWGAIMLIFNYFVGVRVGANKCCCQWGNICLGGCLGRFLFLSFFLRQSIFMRSQHRVRSPAHARRQICDTFTVGFHACNGALQLLNSPSRRLQEMLQLDTDKLPPQSSFTDRPSCVISQQYGI